MGHNNIIRVIIILTILINNKNAMDVKTQNTKRKLNYEKQTVQRWPGRMAGGSSKVMNFPSTEQLQFAGPGDGI